MLQNAHFGTGSDALQQVHGAGVKSNESSIFYAKHHNSQKQPNTRFTNLLLS